MSTCLFFHCFKYMIFLLLFCWFVIFSIILMQYLFIKFIVFTIRIKLSSKFVVGYLFPPFRHCSGWSFIFICVHIVILCITFSWPEFCLGMVLCVVAAHLRLFLFVCWGCVFGFSFLFLEMVCFIPAWPTRNSFSLRKDGIFHVQ